MDSTQPGSGDNSNRVKSPRSTGIGGPSSQPGNNEIFSKDGTDKMDCTSQMIDDNETNLKERIAQCKNLIDSLKFELNEEKFKLEKGSKTIENPLGNMASFGSPGPQVSSTDTLKTDPTFPCNIYTACIDSKLNCDENLMEYEKQLQKYQNTLNMAQTEKKNAIRKQMLAKAYRLKLLEIENQCNVELLRVKQSLQCLEPLKIIANKWKSNPNNNHDGNSFDLIPRYPEINANYGTEASFFENLDTKIAAEVCEECTKNKH